MKPCGKNQLSENLLALEGDNFWSMVHFFVLFCLHLVGTGIGMPCAQRDYNGCPEVSACLAQESL